MSEGEPTASSALAVTAENTPMKRRKRGLTIQRKKEIIEIVDNAPPRKKRREIAEEQGIPPTTLSSILKNRAKIVKQFQEELIEPKRKRLRKANHADIEEALLEWYRHRLSNEIVTGPVLLKKAEELARGLGKDDFTCTGGWVERFKARHGISFKRVRITSSAWIRIIWNAGNLE